MLPCFGKLSSFAHGFFHVFFQNVVHIGYFPPREPTNMYHDSYIFKMVAKNIVQFGIFSQFLQQLYLIGLMNFK